MNLCSILLKKKSVFKIMKSLSFVIILIILHGAVGKHEHNSTGHVTDNDIIFDHNEGKYI